MRLAIQYNSNYFWRIVFTIMVTVVHSNWLGEYHPGWYLSAEYFFMLSGFFLVNHLEKKRDGVFAYIGKRISKFYPYQIFAFLLLFLWNYRALWKEREWKEGMYRFLLHLGEALPFTYFYSDYERIGSTFLNYPVWYLSVLLFVSILFYYLALHYRQFFVNLFLPFSIILIYRYFYVDCPNIGAAEYEGILINAFYLRGIGAMSLGSLIYYLIKKLETVQFSRSFFIFIRLLEFFSLFSMIGLSWFFGDTKNDVYLVFLLGIGVACTFMYPQKTILSASWMKKLGEFTFPVYLNHVLIFGILNSGYFSLPESFFLKYLLFTILIIPYCLFLVWLIKMIVTKLENWCKKLFILS